MKVKITCRAEKYDEFKNLFESNGFTISEDAEYHFKDISQIKDDMLCFDYEGTKHFINLEDVCLIEADDYKNQIYLRNGMKLFVNEKLYEFEADEYNDYFIRVNKSQIVGLSCIKKVSPQFNSRLKLSLINGSVVYVSRTYNINFRDTIDKRRK